MASAFNTRFAEAAPRMLEAMGEAVTYTPSGGVAASVTILFSETEGVYEETSDGRMLVRTANATIFEADVSGPGKGDKFVLGSDTWTFREQLDRGGTGRRFVFVTKERENFGNPIRKG